MNTDRIKEIQKETAYPESVSVQQALLKVWNETAQEQEEWISELQKASFWSKCEYGSYCWNWKGSKSKDGYGKFRLDGKVFLASRIAYQIIHGEIDNNINVLHECDNPSCINPSHLFLGTHLDNMIDKSFKNRARHTRKSSPFTGVGFRNDIKRWRCYIKEYGIKTIHLGSFETDLEAAEHRENYIIENKINAKLNFSNQTLTLTT